MEVQSITAIVRGDGCQAADRTAFVIALAYLSYCEASSCGKTKLCQHQDVHTTISTVYARGISVRECPVDGVVELLFFHGHLVIIVQLIPGEILINTRRWKRFVVAEKEALRAMMSGMM